MSLAHLQVRTRLVLVLVLVNALMLAAAAFGWHAIGQVNRQLESSVKLKSRFEAATDQVQNAQLQFKTQVLAWKNIMLRGKDPEQLLYYEKAFQAASTAVQDHLSAALNAVQTLGLDPQLAVKAMEVHIELKAKYAQALHLQDGSSVEGRTSVAKINKTETEQTNPGEDDQQRRPDRRRDRERRRHAGSGWSRIGCPRLFAGGKPRRRAGWCSASHARSKAPPRSRRPWPRAT